MLVTPFQWKLLFLLSFLFFAFSVSMVVFTLLLVYEVKEDMKHVDHTKLRFVEIGNWIFAGIILLGVITSWGGWWGMKRIYQHFEKVDTSGLNLKPADFSKHESAE